MKRYIIGFIFLFFNLLTSQISVSLDNSNIREVPLFGLANSSLRYNDYEDSGLEYDFGEPDFESAALCINPHVLTFPGANPCYKVLSTVNRIVEKQFLLMRKPHYRF